MVIKGNNKSDYCLDSHVSVSAIDPGISPAVRDSSKLSMTKVFLIMAEWKLPLLLKKILVLKETVESYMQKMVFSRLEFATSLLRRQTCLKRPPFT